MTSNFEVTSPKLALSEETANRGNEHKHFEERLEKALTDDNMHQALERFAPSWLTSRSNVFGQRQQEQLFTKLIRQRMLIAIFTICAGEKGLIL